MTLTSDQNNEFQSLKLSEMQDIKTEPGLTEQQIHQDLKLMLKNDTEELYHYLRSNHPSALELHIWLSGLRRRIPGRVTEARRAAANNITSLNFQNIKNKLGLSQSVSMDRVRTELKRLSTKSSATWKALNLNKAATLKEYDVQ